MTARDTIAELLGLVYVPVVRCWYTDPAAEDRHFICADPTHPIPNTIDFIAAVWPEGWQWDRHSGTCRYAALAPGHSLWTIAFLWSGNELADRMSLYAKVLEWLREHDRPAFDAAVAKARRVMEEAR